MEQQPSLYSLEHGEKKDHSERKLDIVEKEQKDANEELRTAREILLTDAMYARFFQAMADRENRDATNFAYIENLFIKYCRNLPEKDIDTLVQKFNRAASEYAAKNAGLLREEHARPENLKRRVLNASGITSVINFISAREQLLGASPATEYDFYVENELDAKYKIDLIECIYNREGGELSIDTMNLIQVKSSEPPEDDARKIIESHRSWILSSVMDFDSFKLEYTDGIPESVTIRQLAQNSEEVEMILLDLCTDPQGFNPDDFIKRLNLEELNNKQKAWLLVEYGALIRNYIVGSEAKGLVTQEQRENIVNALDELESKMRSKAKLPRNIAHIKNVNSVIAVGPKITRTEPLVSQEQGRRTDKIIRYA